MIKAYPVRYEIYNDEHDSLMGVVEAFDEAAATVETKVPFSPAEWDEFSAEVKRCLSEMDLVGE